MYLCQLFGTLSQLWERLSWAFVLWRFHSLSPSQADREVWIDVRKHRFKKRCCNTRKAWHNFNSDFRQRQLWINGGTPLHKTLKKYNVPVFLCEHVNNWVSDHLESNNSVRSHKYKLVAITRCDVIVVWWQLHLLWSLSRQPAVPEESGSPPSLFAHPADHLPSSKSGWKVTCEMENWKVFYFPLCLLPFLSLTNIC